MRKLWTGCAVLLAACVGGIAWGQGASVPLPAESIVAARKAGFDLQGGVVAGMKTAIDTGADVKGFRDAAAALSAWGHVIPAMFPDGTQGVYDTKARPEVWTDRAGFQKAAETFWTQADKLAALAEANDKAGFAAQYTATTQACGGCHRNFRQRS